MSASIRIRSGRELAGEEGEGEGEGVVGAASAEMVVIGGDI
jgi:hypothetical protein